MEHAGVCAIRKRALWLDHGNSTLADYSIGKQRCQSSRPTPLQPIGISENIAVSIFKTNTTPIHRNLGFHRSPIGRPFHLARQLDSRQITVWDAAQSPPPLARLGLLNIRYGTLVVLLTQQYSHLCHPWHFRRSSASRRSLSLELSAHWAPRACARANREAACLSGQAGRAR